jgi:transposase InsO family protein
MREKGLISARKRRFRCATTDSKHAFPIAQNLLARNFQTPSPNVAWVGDVTFIPTLEGWLYLAVILDLYSRKVVGWAASALNDRALALEALQRAITARKPTGALVFHSDRGSPYASDDYRAALARNGITQSMSRTGDCWDNAVAESFFASLKGELVDHISYVTRLDALESIGNYIDYFYNTYRRHSTIGYVCPVEFELRLQSCRAAA